MVRKLKSRAIACNQVFCAKNVDFMGESVLVFKRWTWNGLKLLQNIVLSPEFHHWNKKKAIFNVKYEVVLRTPYSKAPWGGGALGTPQSDYVTCAWPHIENDKNCLHLIIFHSKDLQGNPKFKNGIIKFLNKMSPKRCFGTFTVTYLHSLLLSGSQPYWALSPTQLHHPEWRSLHR